MHAATGQQPPDQPALLCDAMLAGLARWLRAAGHDTALAEPGSSDRQLLADSDEHHRLLITRDRLLAQRAKPGTAVLLTSGKADVQAQELASAIRLDWLYAPFTRCLIDNAALQTASAADVTRAPPLARDLPGPFRTCPSCTRLYWPGSHVRRMLARLEHWAAASTSNRRPWDS